MSEDERLVRPEKVDEAISAMLSAAEGCGANMLELVQACRSIEAAAKVQIRIDGASILAERAGNI